MEPFTRALDTWRSISSRELTALLAYLGVLAAGFLVSAAMLSDLVDARTTLATAQDTLGRLERAPRSAEHDAAGAEDHASPFLAGATITIAGAALQARVDVAAKSVGARVLTSRIDFDVPRAAEGFVGLSDSLELRETDLQPLLYDLEAGSPFLIVESLEIESPRAFGEREGAPMRVKIGATGQWRQTP